MLYTVLSWEVTVLVEQESQEVKYQCWFYISIIKLNVPFKKWVCDTPVHATHILFCLQKAREETLKINKEVRGSWADHML